MLKTLHAAIALVICGFVFTGCNPGIKVVQSPTKHNKGIRYYRPKPYLLISPAGEVATAKNDQTTTTTREMSDETVSIELQYLPDFSEEYAITVRPGLGVANVNFKLEDGWNLTEMNQQLDSKFADNVKAISELVKAGGSLGSPSNFTTGDNPSGESKSRWVVKSTNVPLGYYEAVINVDSQCKKRLYGWRYVGFAPFNSCPTTVYGEDVAACDDPNGPIYGLVFEQGVMCFKQLNELHNADPTRVAVRTGEVKTEKIRTPDGPEDPKPPTKPNQNQRKTPSSQRTSSSSTSLNVQDYDEVESSDLLHSNP